MITYEVGSTYHLPPSTLLLERNIREAKPDKGLIDSIAALGVLEPISAVVNDAGGLVVRSGHRRTLAALEAKAATVPVYVRGTDSLEQEDEIHRVISQRDENTHRAGLTAAEDLNAVDQLVAFGLTAEQVAQQARMGREQVVAARRVSKSKLAAKATVKYDLTLDQAVAVAEFDDDTEAVKALVASASTGQFDHTVQRMRDDRAEKEKRTAIADEMTAGGGTVIDAPQSYGDKTLTISRLVDQKTGKEIKLEEHTSCPGHVGWVAMDWVGTRREPVAKYGCADPKKNGHRDRHASGASKPPAAQMTDAEREQARKDRRFIIDSNKDWASAETVRRQWIRDNLAKANTPPKGSAAFIAIAISADGGHFIHDWKFEPDHLTREWLGIKKSSGRLDLSAHVKGKPESRALVIALLHLLATYETKAAGKDAWRRDGTSNDTGRYLRYLETVGYVLSDVEKYAISKKRPA